MVCQLPGYELGRATTIGDRQGLQEQFVNTRTYTPVNLSFYVENRLWYSETTRQE